MMARLTMVTTGDESLNRALQRLQGPRQKKAVRKASREALKPLAAATKSAAPRLTGRLARAIKVRALPRSRVKIGTRVTIGAGMFKGETFYGGFVVYGHLTGKRGSENRKEVPANEFMRTTAKAKKSSVLADYRRRLRKLIVELALED